MIFLAIGLFAAVSYAVLDGSRVGAASLNKEQSRLAAQEIVGMAQSIGTAVNKLRLNGCADTDLNFINTPTGTDFDNTGAPGDGSCDVFKLTGGSVNYEGVNANYQTTGAGNHYYFNSQTIISGSGTASNDLTLWVKDLKPEVCKEINKISIGLDPATEAVGAHTQFFTGSFASTIAGGVGDDVGSIYNNKSSGCIIQGGTVHNFYQVLVAR